MVSCNLLAFSPQDVSGLLRVRGELSSQMAPPPYLSFYFNSLPGAGGVKAWKLSRVLAKKPPTPAPHPPRAGLEMAGRTC